MDMEDWRAAIHGVAKSQTLDCVTELNCIYGYNQYNKGRYKV